MKIKIALEIYQLDVSKLQEIIKKLKTKRMVELELDYFTTQKEAMIGASSNTLNGRD